MKPYPMTDDEMRSVGRWFFWGPQWFYSWPIKIVRGDDEFGWRTLGVVTWAGSIFYRTSFCECANCDVMRDQTRSWAQEPSS